MSESLPLALVPRTGLLSTGEGSSGTDKKRWALYLARRYAAWTLRSRFDGFFVEGIDVARQMAAERPVIFAANHVSWWDAFALVAADEALGTDGYVLMDERNLARLPFFRALGALPLNVAGGKRGVRQLHRAATLLHKPERALWVFPQGRQRAAHLRPLGFKPGLGWIARQSRASGAVVIPVALSYPWRNAPCPAIAMSFGEPVDPITMRPDALVTHLEERVVAMLHSVDSRVDADMDPCSTLLLKGRPRKAEDGMGARVLKAIMDR